MRRLGGLRGGRGLGRCGKGVDDALESDVVVSYSDTQSEADTFVTSSHGLAIPAVKSGAVAELVGTEFIASVSPPTALSLPWGLDTLVEQLAVAAK